jgi:hypothetical protein
MDGGLCAEPKPEGNTQDLFNDVVISANLDKSSKNDGPKASTAKTIIKPAPRKVDILPSGVELPQYSAQYWEEFIVKYNKEEAHKCCVDFLNESVKNMGDKLEIFRRTFYETIDALREIQEKCKECKCNGDLGKLRELLKKINDAYQKCVIESNIDVGSLQKQISSFLILFIKEIKELQNAIQQLRIHVSSMLKEIREIRQKHKQAAHPDQVVLDNSKIIKIDLSILENTLTDLMDIMDNIIDNIINMLAAIHAQERKAHQEEIYKRKGERSLFANR